MKKEQLKQLCEKYGIVPDVWTPTFGISEIKISNGTSVFPDITKLRFRYDSKHKSLDVLYGKTSPFGALFAKHGNWGIGFRNIDFMWSPNQLFTTGFRTPRIGDTFRISYSGKVLFETMITAANCSTNMCSFNILTPANNLVDYGRMSYYDSRLKDTYSIDGNIWDGVYLKFTPEPKKRKDYTVRYKARQIISILGKGN
jgi:hypothetical protein